MMGIAALASCEADSMPESNHTKVVAVIARSGSRNKGRVRLDCVDEGGTENERCSDSRCDSCSRSSKRLATNESGEHSPAPSGGPALFSVAV